MRFNSTFRRLLIYAFLFFNSISFANIINIPDDYPSIQEGIDASIDGDTVLVAPGEYEGIFTLQGKNILLTSSSGPDVTTIAGAFLFDNGEDTTCVLRGFKIIGNSGYSGIRCTNNSSPIIEANIITGHTSMASSGVNIQSNNCIVRNNIISGNQNMDIGAGIKIFGDSIVITQNIIKDNEVYQYFGKGGGLYLKGTATITYNQFIHNVAVGGPAGADGAGGGIFKIGVNDTLGSFTCINNNTFVSNEAWAYDYQEGSGGAIFVQGFLDQENDTLMLKNNIFAYNYTDGLGNAIRANSTDSLYFCWDYNCLYGNDIYGFDQGIHDVLDDPMFVDTSCNNYNLQPDSPCIDAGDPDSPLDPDSTRADIGALFYDQTVDIDDYSEPSNPYSFELYQNYPNPFNAQTIISYNLPRQSVVSLNIFSITGQLVKSIINEESQIPAEYKYIWNGTDQGNSPVCTGIYFYQLKIGCEIENKAMILIK